MNLVILENKVFNKYREKIFNSKPLIKPSLKQLRDSDTQHCHRGTLVHSVPHGEGFNHQCANVKLGRLRKFDI